ncbi:(2Fe-2S)-binding protein [Maribellus sp. YY47]|uniref:(2Fe-2S)-binding protein n=1 Tax=Maribellus sp. YY47 TaxID=2929486 RepID=UPI00200090D8|nr:(2Fe-2S)-binding protein [Maribellus sp. YY47]MCK3683035.1 (2Fe-2S)-binding protein [Maribellus sp. YY47]
MARKLVCICNLIEESEIKSVLAKGAETTSHIQKFTRAGTSCGRCLPEIDAIVEEHQKKKPKNQQGKLELGL